MQYVTTANKPIAVGFKPKFLNAYFNRKEIAEQELYYNVLMVLRTVQVRQKDKSKLILFKDARQAVCPRLRLSAKRANTVFEEMGRAGLLLFVPFNGLVLYDSVVDSDADDLQDEALGYDGVGLE